MTGKEIIKKLHEYNITPSVLDGEEWEHYEKEGGLDNFLDKHFGENKTIKAERENEYYEIVHYFNEHNVYICGTGYYDSWSGITWDDDAWIEVVPVEKTIIVYRSKID